jgi:hypothetical protein
MKLYVASALFIFQCSAVSLASQLIEHTGRFDINWSSSKVRFYGSSTHEAAEESMRPAEQRAWSEGLTFASQNLRQIFYSNNSDKNFSNLTPMSQCTTSVSTTYFGDKKIKVLLETPMSKLISDQNTNAVQKGSHQEPTKSLVIKLPKGSKPTLMVRIVDESGLELLSETQLKGAIDSGVDMPKWYKSKLSASDNSLLHDAPQINGIQVGSNTIKVQADDWRKSFQEAFLDGSAGFLIQ